MGVPDAPVASCPVCQLSDGFHDTAAHRAHEVPRELLKEKDWHKQQGEPADG